MEAVTRTCFLRHLPLSIDDFCGCHKNVAVIHCKMTVLKVKCVSCASKNTIPRFIRIKCSRLEQNTYTHKYKIIKKTRLGIHVIQVKKL